MQSIRKCTRVFAAAIAFFVAVSMAPFITPQWQVYGAGNWESEKNDSRSTANAISVNNTYYGNIHQPSDKDYYWFETTTAGVVTLTFNHEYINSPSAYWTVCLLNEDRNTILSKNIQGNQKSVTFTKLGLPAGIYYVCVEAYSNSSWNSATYNFKAAFSASGNWESEYNDDRSTADAISVGRRYYGNIRYSSDSDYYWFHLSKRTKLKLNFKHASIKSSQNYWDINIYNSGNVNKYYNIKGNKTSTTYNAGYLPAGDYYVKVNGYSYDRWSSKDYSFNIYQNHCPYGTKFTAVKGQKRAAALKWKKSSDASGYEIYRATSKGGKYKKIKTIKNRSTVKFTSKKLKKNKRYYYKIRSYRIVKGKKYYSAFSAVKSVKAK